MKTIIALLLAATSFCVQAADNKMHVVLCAETQVMYATLFKEYGETPIVSGTSSDDMKGTMIFLVNPKTTSWTVVITTEKESCIVANGVDFKIRKSSGKPV